MTGRWPSLMVAKENPAQGAENVTTPKFFIEILSLLAITASLQDR
jgi:hypothetical protein